MSARHRAVSSRIHATPSSFRGILMEMPRRATRQTLFTPGFSAAWLDRGTLRSECNRLSTPVEGLTHFLPRRLTSRHGCVYFSLSLPHPHGEYPGHVRSEGIFFREAIFLHQDSKEFFFKNIRNFLNWNILCCMERIIARNINFGNQIFLCAKAIRDLIIHLYIPLHFYSIRIVTFLPPPPPPPASLSFFVAALS